MSLGVGGTVVAKARAVLEADTRGMDRGLAQSEQRFQKWHKVATASALGVGLALGGMAKKAVDAAKEAQTSQQRMDTQLKAVGTSYKAHSDLIDKVIAKQSKMFAFDDEDLQGTFTSFVRSTGDVQKALKLNAVAADVARGKNISLEAAATLVTKANMGQAGALKRAGIEVAAVTTQQDRLKARQAELAQQLRGKLTPAQKEHIRHLIDGVKAQKDSAKAADMQAAKASYVAMLQQKFSGQAKTYGESGAAASDRQKVAAENLAEAYGKGLLPVYTDAQNELAHLLGVMAEHQGATRAAIATAAGLATAVLAVNGAMKLYSAGSTVAGGATKIADAAMQAYRARLWAVAAAQGEVTLATKGAAAAQGLMAAAGGPIGLAIGGLGLLALALSHSKDAAKDEEAQLKRNADRYYEMVSAAGAAADAALAVRSAKLGAKEAAAAVGQAEESRDAAIAAKDPKAIAAANLTLARSKITLAQATQEAANKAKAEQKAQREALEGAQGAARILNDISAKKREVARLEKAASDQSLLHRAGGLLTPGGVTDEDEALAKAKRELAAMEKHEKKATATLVKLREDRRGNFEKVDGTIFTMSNRYANSEAAARRRWAKLGTAWGVAELAKYPGQIKPHVDAANRTLKRTGDVRLDPAKIQANLVKPFDGMGAKISAALGTVNVNMKATLDAVFGGPAGGAGGGNVGPLKGVDQVGPIAAGFGLAMTSGFRLGDPGYHGQNRARDYSNGTDTPQEMAFARYMASRYGGNLTELIHTPLGFGIKNGRKVPLSYWGDKVNRMHHNHVHVAMQRGGLVPGMPWSPSSGDSVPAILEPDEVVVNRSFTRAYPGGPAAFHRDTNGAVPRFQSGGVVPGGTIAAMIRAEVKRQGGNPNGPIAAALIATAMNESRLNPRAQGDVVNGRPTSFGLFQFHRGGALGQHTPEWAYNPINEIRNRTRLFLAGKVTTGAGAARIQRPADPSGYAAAVDGLLKKAGKLGLGAGDAIVRTRVRPTSSAAVMAAAAKQAKIDADAELSLQQSKERYNAQLVRVAKAEKAAARGTAKTKKDRLEALKTARAELRSRADDLVAKRAAAKQARADEEKAREEDRETARKALEDAAAERAETLRNALLGRTSGALAKRNRDDDLETLIAGGTKDTADDLTALDHRRATSADRVAMSRAAVGMAVDDDTRKQLEDQLNDAIREQIELDQQRTTLIEQQNEAVQEGIRSAVSTKFAFSDAERDLAWAKAEATDSIEDDKQAAAADIDAWAKKLADVKDLEQRTDLTEATRIDLMGQEASATRGLTAAQKKQSELTDEVASQLQERAAAENAAILSARSRFQSEFASNTFSPSAGGGYVNGAASTPTEVHVHNTFETQPEDPWVWIKKSQHAAESVFGG